MSIRRLLCLQNCCAASTTTISNSILPLKMANRFIPYVPKPTNEKYCSKPLCKNMPKEFSIFDDSQRVERNLVRVSAMDSDLPMQKVNGDDRIMVEGMLKQHILSCIILM